MFIGTSGHRVALCKLWSGLCGELRWRAWRTRCLIFKGGWDELQALLIRVSVTKTSKMMQNSMMKPAVLSVWKWNFGQSRHLCGDLIVRFSACCFLKIPMSICSFCACLHDQDLPGVPQTTFFLFILFFFLFWSRPWFCDADKVFRLLLSDLWSHFGRRKATISDISNRRVPSGEKWRLCDSPLRQACWSVWLF